MAKAKLAKQIMLETGNKVGTLAEVSNVAASAGVNIEAICAYAMEDKAIFYLVTGNNKDALSLFKAKGYSVKEDEVVLVSLPNTVGSAASMAGKLKAANIDLQYIYGSTSSAKEALIVIKSDNNTKALEALK